jgi:transposase-like protein
VARTGSNALSEFKPCPKCQAQNATRVGYTWWGGVLGPKLFTHVKCGSCSTTFNGKTGKSNNTAIAIYSVVLFVVVLGLYAMVRL